MNILVAFLLMATEGNLGRKMISMTVSERESREWDSESRHVDVTRHAIEATKKAAAAADEI